MAYRCPSRALSGIAALGAALAGFASWGHATPPEQRGPRLEVWLGGEAFQDIWSAHTGATWAPFGDLQEDGFRMRAVVGHGDYRGGTVEIGDVLIGYHTQLGRLTLKLFGGIAVAEHRPRQEALSGVGGKGVLEAWWSITDQAWASADVWLASPHLGHSDRADYGSRLRLGWRLWPQLAPELSAGVEAGCGGLLAPTLERGISRAGGFLRYEWTGGEVSISGGVFVDGRGGPEGRQGAARPFATVSVLTRF